MNLGMDRALRSGETTYYPQLELENSRSLPDGTDKDSHPGRCNCKVCKRNRKEETRLLRFISGDPETTTATGAWKMDVPLSLMSTEELDRLTSAVALTFVDRNKKRHKSRRIKDVAVQGCYVRVHRESDQENKIDLRLEESEV